MSDILEMIYEYRTLVARTEHLSIPLDDRESGRLVALGQLLSGTEPSQDARRQMPRWPFPSRVELTVAGGFACADVLNLSGGGLAIELRAGVALGPRTIARVASEQGGEYVFPCRVAWRRQRGPNAIVGLAFDGVPTLATYSSPGHHLRFGPSRTTPITA